MTSTTIKDGSNKDNDDEATIPPVSCTSSSSLTSRVTRENSNPDSILMSSNKTSISSSGGGLTSNINHKREPQQEDTDNDNTKSSNDADEGKYSSRRRKRRITNKVQNWIVSLTQLLQRTSRHVPFGRQLWSGFLRLPPSLRNVFLIGFVLWKGFVGIVVLRFVLFSSSGATYRQALRSHFGWSDDINSLNDVNGLNQVSGWNDMSSDVNDSGPLKILHIVTSLREYDDGVKGTVKGYDRLQNNILPLLLSFVDSVHNEQPNWSVDVYLIFGSTLSPERTQLIQSKLSPYNVGLEIWDDAVPIGYERGKDNLSQITRCLARQHRYVIKDKLDQYDFFSVFEDDMRITAQHIRHFRTLSTQIQLLTDQAEEREKEQTLLPPNDHNNDEQLLHDRLNSTQLKRMIPGFMRVEVLPTEQAASALKNKPSKVPTDWHFSNQPIASHVNPLPCCSFLPTVTKTNTQQKLKLKKTLPPPPNLPINPNPNQLVVWETDIQAFSVRPLAPSPPQHNQHWIALLPAEDKLQKNTPIPSYWTGSKHRIPMHEKPSIKEAKMFAQSAGFMASKTQIKQFVTRCEKETTFLPPFTNMKEDGLYMNNVEFYSGGYQLFGPCGYQRVVSIDSADLFSNHLLYHASNNKQRTNGKNRLVKADTLLGQLNAVKKEAISIITQEKKEEEGAVI